MPRVLLCWRDKSKVIPFSRNACVVFLFLTVPSLVTPSQTHMNCSQALVLGWMWLNTRKLGVTVKPWQLEDYMGRIWQFCLSPGDREMWWCGLGSLQACLMPGRAHWIVIRQKRFIENAMHFENSYFRAGRGKHPHSPEKVDLSPKHLLWFHAKFKW